MNNIPLFTLMVNRHQLQVLSCALLLSWLILLLSACGVQNETNPTGLSPAPLQGTEMVQSGVDSASVPTTYQATMGPTATPTDLEALTPSPTPTKAVTYDMPTPVPTETIPPSPTPTLTAEEIRQRWQIIDDRVAATMASNNGCQLPCWWGIKPGDSVTEGRQIFNAINEDGWVDSSDQRGELQWIGFFDHFYRNEMGEYIYAGFTIDLLTQGESIKVINIHVERSSSFSPGTSEYDQISERLIRDWEQYSVQNMFEMFGAPDLIYLLPRNFADGDNFYYEFNLYYQSVGIAVSYSSPLSIGNNGERTICLDMFDMNSVDLFLYDPAIELPADYLQATYSLWPLSSELKPEDFQLVEGNDLQSLMGMSIDEFVIFMLENEGDNDCFTVN